MQITTHHAEENLPPSHVALRYVSYNPERLLAKTGQIAAIVSK